MKSDDSGRSTFEPFSKQPESCTRPFSSMVQKNADVAVSRMYDEVVRGLDAREARVRPFEP